MGYKHSEFMQEEGLTKWDLKQNFQTFIFKFLFLFFLISRKVSSSKFLTSIIQLSKAAVSWFFVVIQLSKGAVSWFFVVVGWLVWGFCLFLWLFLQKLKSSKRSNGFLSEDFLLRRQTIFLVNWSSEFLIWGIKETNGIVFLLNISVRLLCFFSSFFQRYNRVL